jgi:hypothetical protein
VPLLPDAGAALAVVTPDAAPAALPVPVPLPAPAGARDLGLGTCAATVDSLPPKARLKVGGTEVGIAPAELAGLPCDTPVAVEAYLDKWEPYNRKATFSVDKKSFVASLRRVQVEIAVSSTPPGALVLLAGKPAGKTPLRTRVNGFVKTTVKLSMAGYREVDTQLVARPGQKSDVAVTLEKLPRTGKPPLAPVAPTKTQTGFKPAPVKPK